MKLFYVAFVMGYFVFSLESPAYAYLDPGTGSFILQMLLAGFFGAIIALKAYWHKIKSFFIKPDRNKD